MRSIFTPVSVCTICKEYIPWICDKYERMDYVTLTLSAEFIQNQDRTLRN
jgi:hypothetical protein